MFFLRISVTSFRNCWRIWKAGPFSWLGFTVTISNVGVGDVENVELNDPLPSGDGNDIFWSIPAGGNPSGLFVLNGSTGTQTLALAPNTNLVFNESISVNIVGAATVDDVSETPLTNTATVAALNETQDFLGNNTATATITIMPQPAAVSIEKSTNGQDADAPTGPLVAVGSTVTWTYEVTNTGATPLTTVSVIDDQGVIISGPLDDDGDGVLSQGETWTYSATGTAIAG